MKLLADFFPVILFFAAYQISGIYVATATAIVASLAQVGYHWLSKRRIETMHLFMLAIVLVFGGLTLLLQDRTFIMWKPSVVNWLFGLVLLGSQFIGRQPLIQNLLGGSLVLPDRIWRRLNLAWSLFFIAIGFLNIYVANDFFVAQTRLLDLSGLSQIDFDHCSSLFNGDQLEMCNTAHSLEQSWVNFKLFGMMGLTLVFSLLQAFYLARHLSDREGPQEEN